MNPNFPELGKFKSEKMMIYIFP